MKELHARVAGEVRKVVVGQDSVVSGIIAGPMARMALAVPVRLTSI